jgi:hypothetical protein
MSLFSGLLKLFKWGVWNDCLLAAAAEFNAMEHKVVGEGEVCLDSIKLRGRDMNIQLLQIEESFDNRLWWWTYPTRLPIIACYYCII